MTGSGRLELFGFGGDSLQGRYHLLRLHPFSVTEAGITSDDGLNQLLHLGGFPEPFLGGGEVEARRWSRQYRARLLDEDVASLTNIRDLGRLEETMLRLPDLVGSPLSVNALREDLQVAHRTVAAWLDTLERLYAVFRLPPFVAPRTRAVKQERKHYHFDWSLVTDPGARFENLVACHLLKWVHHLQDTEGRDLELRFFRDVDGREVDFVVVDRAEPILLVECKLRDRDIDRGLRYLKARFPAAQAHQIALSGQRDYVTPTASAPCPHWISCKRSCDPTAETFLQRDGPSEGGRLALHSAARRSFYGDTAISCVGQGHLRHEPKRPRGTRGGRNVLPPEARPRA